MYTCVHAICASLPRWKSEPHISNAAKLSKTLRKQAETLDLAAIDPQILQRRHYFREFDPNSPFLALGRLRGRIRHALATHHLEERPPGEFRPLHDTLRGRVSYSSAEHEVAFVIDGKFLTLAQFAKMVVSYVGWQFRLDFLDEGEEVR